MDQILLDKPAVPQFVKKLIAMYGTRMFMIVFTEARHVSLLLRETNPIKALPPYFFRPLLILHAHTCQHLQSGLVPSCCSTRASIRATCPVHLSFLDLGTL